MSAINNATHVEGLDQQEEHQEQRKHRADDEPVSLHDLIASPG
jgi:hypothetical protein